jgi:outer membrane protein
MSKKISFALAALTAIATLGAAPAASAQAAGDLMVRGRLVNIDPANQDNIPSLDVSVSNKVIPEVDFTYFLSPSLSAELILTYPQKHNVSANGSAVGTLKHLPPTLTLQYRFNDLGLGAFTPYVGAGLNYTRFSSVNLGGGTLSVDKNSFGLALQAGVDYAIDKNWSVNFDVKKVQIRTDLKDAAGTSLGTLKIDPLLVGVGVGYKF